MADKMEWCDVVGQKMGQCAELVDSLTSMTSEDERRRVVRRFLVDSEGLYAGQRPPDIPEGLEWLNVSRSLTWDDLRGRVTVIDFFTYCCINCMHLLPYLHKLEDKYSSDGLLVVGVHSGKFAAEKSTASILQALQRNDIHHPVVNDPEFDLWNRFCVSCWPTVLVMSPSLTPLFVLVGEGPKTLLETIVGAALEFCSEQVHFAPGPVPLLPLNRLAPASPLRFPGKVCAHGNRLVVADTGNNRVLVCNMSGTAMSVVGSVEGFQDGSFKVAEFRSPQGVAIHGDLVYVADTGNHAIRQIDLIGKNVVTLVGTRRQGEDYEGGKEGREQEIASPWDVCIGSLNDEADTLFIAMAGTHQIWAYMIRTCMWRNKELKAGTCLRLAGSGKEENRNNAYPASAGFAQPSGLWFDGQRRVLYIADSESSSVRKLSLDDGSVKAVVGGGRDPKDLFCYGDVDGKGAEVRLQHPMGVAFSQHTGMLYVADTYNHKIKAVDVESRSCTTIVTGSLLGEPSGICLTDDGRCLLVADTNNHLIRSVDLTEAKGEIQTLNVTINRGKPDTVDGSDVVRINPSGGTVSIVVGLLLEDGVKLAEEAPQKWELEVPDQHWKADQTKGTFQGQFSVIMEVPPASSGDSKEVKVKLNLYLCSTDGTCHIRSACLIITVLYDKNAGGQTDVQLKHAAKL